MLNRARAQKRHAGRLSLTLQTGFVTKALVSLAISDESQFAVSAGGTPPAADSWIVKQVMQPNQQERRVA